MLFIGLHDLIPLREYLWVEWLHFIAFLMEVCSSEW